MMVFLLLAYDCRLNICFPPNRALLIGLMSELVGVCVCVCVLGDFILLFVLPQHRSRVIYNYELQIFLNCIHLPLFTI